MWRERPEVLLETVDVLAGVVALVRVDLRLGADALHLGDAEALAEHEVPVLDHELVAVERAHGRPSDAVAFGVVGASVAGALEARHAGDRCDRPGPRVGVHVLRVAGKYLRLGRAADGGAG